MRILVISNLYPPYYLGGYEIGCYDAVEGLKKRGHEVKVLTSTYGVRTPIVDGYVYRWLISDLNLKLKPYSPSRIFFQLLHKELYNRRVFHKLFKVFQPDVIYMWSPRFISISLPIVAQGAGIPIAFYIFDDWLSDVKEVDYWRCFWKSPQKK